MSWEKKINVYRLIFSIVGSLSLVFANGAILLIIGRVLQGLSAACIMPATIALVKAYFEGADRQRALSYWSIGSWGGSGICSFAGGAIATYMGWKWIFIFSIIFALLAMWLIKDTPESKADIQVRLNLTLRGLSIFIITLLALNIFITQGANLVGQVITSLLLLAVTIIGIIVFVKYEA